MKFDPATNIQDLLQFGEYGDVNPSITDSSTFTFMKAITMADTFSGTTEGCFLYSRHWNPSNKYLSDALAAMEGTEAAWVTASGMAAITSAILQICNSGDHIVSSHATYGGTFAFFQNYLPKFDIGVTFVDITDLEAVKKAIKPNTKIIYAETMTNPMLQISDIPELSIIANNQNAKLIVDNTFTPMMVTPAKWGAHVIIHSMTKFINGKSDCVAGVICGSLEFISSLCDINSGTAMLLGPALDPLRSSSILKNIHTLHIRMKQHSRNAQFLAEKFKEIGLKVYYPGLKEHKGHETLKKIMNPEFGFGGIIAIDLKTAEKASRFMEKMELEGVGYLAVSLGYFKTLFCNSGQSTSSEIPEEKQKEMGMSDGLVRYSVGLDNDIERSYQKILKCLKESKTI
jgi:methionine-gamma-lyase